MSLAEPATLPVAATAPPRLLLLRRFSARFKTSLPAYLLLLPSLIFLALFTYGAMGRVMIDALYQRATPKAPVRFVGFENINAVLADPAFTGAIVNNLIYAVGTAIPSIGLALLFALALSRTNAFNSVLQYIQDTAFAGGFRLGYAAALGWIYFLIIFVILMVVVKVTNRYVFYAGERQS